MTISRTGLQNVAEHGLVWGKGKGVKRLIATSLPNNR